MTSTSNRLPLRTVAQFSVIALFTAAAVVGCGSSNDGSSSASNGGSSGATGSGGKGQAGSSVVGDAGAPNGGNAGTSTGGSSTGGKSGNGGGGSAEGGEAGMTAAATCGNGTLDPGEECDDGNTADWDGCSSNCSKKCEQCEKAACAANDPASFDVCYGEASKQPQATGPAAGVAKGQLCRDVLACVRESKCTEAFWGLPLQSCYCGIGVSPTDCETAPKGPCAEQIASGAGSRSYKDVARYWTQTNLATGAAASILTQCDQPACPRECFQDKAPSNCEKCALGSDPWAYNVLCDFGPCYLSTAQSTDDPNNKKQLPMGLLCGSAVDCAMRTGCGSKGVDNCYGNGTGPCAAEFAAAADSTDTATVVARLHSGFSYPANVASVLLDCEAANCASACFPTSGSGGSGAGSGGGGTGGATGGTGGGGTGGAAAGTSGGGAGGS